MSRLSRTRESVTDMLTYLFKGVKCVLHVISILTHTHHI
jgi:hypothetical protein